MRREGPERATGTASRSAGGGRAPQTPQRSFIRGALVVAVPRRSSLGVSSLYPKPPARRRDDGQLPCRPAHGGSDRLHGKPAGWRGTQRRLAELRHLRRADSQRARGALAGARRGVDHLSLRSAAGSGADSQERGIRRLHAAQPLYGFGEPGGCECVEPSDQTRWRGRPRLQRFIDRYKNNPDTTPEFGAPCAGGTSATAAADTLQTPQRGIGQ